VCADRRDLDEYEGEDNDYDLEGSDMSGSVSEMSGTGSDSEGGDEGQGDLGQAEKELLPSSPPDQGNVNAQQQLHSNKSR